MRQKKKCIEDLKNDFLELLKQASKEAFKTEEDLFYYLLLKDFYYFNFLEEEIFTYINNSKKTNKYTHDKKQSDFIEDCINIYRTKVKVLNESCIFSSFGSFLEISKFYKNFHDNNDYKFKLQILEQKRKNYPNCYDYKDCNDLDVHDDELNNSNDFSYTDAKMNISPINSSDESSKNSCNGNKRKLESEDKNPKIINFKKRLRDEYLKQNLDNSNTSSTLFNPKEVYQGESYTKNSSINNGKSIIGVVQNNEDKVLTNSVLGNKELNSDFLIKNLIGIKETENQNHSKQYDQNLSNTEHSFSQSSISSQLLKLRESAVRYKSEYDLEKTYEESQKSAFSIVSKRTFNQNPQVPYNLEYRNSHQENFNSNNLPTNQNFYNKLN